HRVRSPECEGWYPKGGSTRAGARASQPPTYPGQHTPNSNVKLQYSFTGSFRPTTGTRHLHRDYSFTGSLVETAPKSLRHSCRSELRGIPLFPEAQTIPSP